MSLNTCGGFALRKDTCFGVKMIGHNDFVFITRKYNRMCFGMII